MNEENVCFKTQRLWNAADLSASHGAVTWSELIDRSASELIDRSASELNDRSASELIDRSASELNDRSASQLIDRSASANQKGALGAADTEVSHSKVSHHCLDSEDTQLTRRAGIWQALPRSRLLALDFVYARACRNLPSRISCTPGPAGICRVGFRVGLGLPESAEKDFVYARVCRNLPNRISCTPGPAGICRVGFRVRPGLPESAK